MHRDPPRGWRATRRRERGPITWTFDRGLPAKIKGPDLNGKSGEIAIEELHIAHEGLHMLLSGARDS